MIDQRRLPSLRRALRSATKRNTMVWAIVSGFLALLVLIPIAEMIVVSLDPMSAVESGQFIPKVLDWGNYLAAWSTVRLWAFLWHSIVVSLSSALLALVLSIMIAFVLARFKFRLRSALALSILVTQMIPAVSLLLPIYILYATLQASLGIPIIGTFYGLIAVDTGTALPLATWLLFSTLVGIPKELDEAAMIDGAHSWKILIKIVVPLALPGLVVAGIFSFLAAWNDILFASVLTGHATRTLAVGLQEYSAGGSGGTGSILWNQLMAAAVISALPAVGLFLFAQRYLINGLTMGGVRG